MNPQQICPGVIAGSLPVGSVSGETEYPSLSSTCLANQNLDRRHYRLFKHFYISSEIRRDSITHLKCVFTACQWAEPSGLTCWVAPWCYSWWQCSSMSHYGSSGASYLCMDGVSHSAGPSCPSPSVQFFELTEGQSLKVAFPPLVLLQWLTHRNLFLEKNPS